MSATQIPLAGFVLLIAFILAALAAGCAQTTSTTLDRMQQEVQNCILSGGHARLGPGNSILCSY